MDTSGRSEAAPDIRILGGAAMVPTSLSKPFATFLNDGVATWTGDRRRVMHMGGHQGRPRRVCVPSKVEGEESCSQVFGWALRGVLEHRVAQVVNFSAMPYFRL